MHFLSISTPFSNQEIHNPRRKSASLSPPPRSVSSASLSLPELSSLPPHFLSPPPPPALIILSCVHAILQGIKVKFSLLQLLLPTPWLMRCICLHL